MSQQNLSEKIFTLPVQEQITPYISQRQIDELPVVVVNHPKVRAAVTLQGAHLLTWQPSGEKPVLWLSSETAFKTAWQFAAEFLFVGLGLALPVSPRMVLPVICLGHLPRMMKMKAA